MNMEKLIYLHKNDKIELERFLENDKDEKIIEIFNSKGLEILSKYDQRMEIFNYILYYSINRDKLFSNNSVIDFFLNNRIGSCYANIHLLSKNTCLKILKRSITINIDTSARLFNFFDKNLQIDIIDSIQFSKELIENILNITDNIKIIDKIFKKYNISLDTLNINYLSFFSNIKEKNLSEYSKDRRGEDKSNPLELEVNLFNKELLDKLFMNYNIFQIRKIINDMGYCTNPLIFNNLLKEREDKIINNTKDGYIDIISEIRKLYLEYQELDKDSNYLEDDHKYDRHFELQNKIFHLLNSEMLGGYGENINIKDKSFLEKLDKINSKILSNYIIDYHFEENYHNIIIDIRELLYFYSNGNVLLDIEHVNLYKKILKIDTLSVDEKLELHNELKKYNMLSMFYDDMKEARNIVYSAIKNQSLSSESIKKYKGEELSKKYGTNVYLMNGEPFFGIVKSVTSRGGSDKYPTGHSFSLIGPGGLVVFDSNKGDFPTFLYDSNSVNKEQFIHAYPFDAFTLYRPYSGIQNSTSSVNMLSMPKELVELYSYSYNELLILESGKLPTEIDNRISKLKRIALYCIDEITEEDVEKAKLEGVGIILINAKKYKNKNSESEYYDRKKMVEDNGGPWEYKYFNDIGDETRHEARR